MPHRTLAAAVLLAVTMVAACGGGDSSGDDVTLKGVVRQPPLGVGRVSLPDVTGGAEATMAMKAAPGELLLVYFGYTSCPDVCPTTMVDIKNALARLGEDAGRVDVAMTTVDPDRDTPEILTGYLDYYLDRFHALRTSDTDELEQAEDAFLASSSVTTSADGQVDVTHTATLYAVDDTGSVVVEWPFGTTSKDVAHDLSALLAERET